MENAAKLCKRKKLLWQAKTMPEVNCARIKKPDVAVK